MRKHGPASFVSTGVKILSRRVARQAQAGSCGKGGASWPHGLFQRVRTSVSVTTAPPARRKPSVTISGGVGRALVRPQRLRRSAPQWGGRLSGRRHWRPHSGRCGGRARSCPHGSSARTAGRGTSGTSGTGRMVAAAAAGPSAGIRRGPELWRQATATSAQSAARGCVGHAPGPGRRLPRDFRAGSGGGVCLWARPLPDFPTLVPSHCSGASQPPRPQQPLSRTLYARSKGLGEPRDGRASLVCPLRAVRGTPGHGAGRGTADQASSRGLTGLLRCASAPSSAGVGVTGHKEAWG